MLIFHIIVNPLITTDPMSQQAKVGDMVTFTCNATAFPAASYSWSTPNSNDFNTSTINLIASYSSVGRYICMVTSNGIIVESQPAFLTGTYIIMSYKIFHCIFATCICGCSSARVKLNTLLICIYIPV